MKKKIMKLQYRRFKSLFLERSKTCLNVRERSKNYF